MKHRKILTIALAVFALVLAASPALAAKAPHRYSPKQGAKCRKGYKRVVKHKGHHQKKVFCVKKATAKKGGTQTPAPLQEKVKLHSHLDPTFTRDPLNPFKVTYAYSASATQEVVAEGKAATASVAGEEPAPLPSGVLALYSDGRLECAVNVGSGVEGSECPVTYQALGQHTVTTIYSSGEQSATETEVEHIEPLATSTTLSVSYAPVAEPTKVGSASGLYLLGDLVIDVGSSPSGMGRLGCGEGSLEHLTASGCYQIESTTEHVYGQKAGSCSAPYLGSIWISSQTERSKIDGEPLELEDIKDGAYHLRAISAAASGYLDSEATAPIQFTPEVSFAPDC